MQPLATDHRMANPQGKWFYLTAAIVFPPASVGFAVVLGVVDYFGWLGALFAMAFVMAVLFFAMTFWVFTSVEIDGERVILRSPLRSIRVVRAAVDRVEINPPIYSLSMEWGWWKRDSQCVIRLHSGRIINASAMPDGLKMRIARALDPTRHGASGV